MAWLGARRLQGTVPLWLVLLIAPILGVIVMAALAGSAYVVSARLASDLARLDRDVIARTERLYDLRLAYANAQVALLDLAAYAANSADPEGIRKRSGNVGTALEAVRVHARALGPVTAAQDREPQQGSLQRDIELWMTFATDAAATLADDSATGMMMIGNTQVLQSRIASALQEQAHEVATDKDATLLAARRQMTATRVGAPVAVLIVGMLLGVLNLAAARHIGTRLRAVRHAMAAVANGRLTAAIPHTGSRDEIARMATALAVLRDTAAERARLETDKERQRQLDSNRAAELRRLTEEFRARASDVGCGLSSASSALSNTARAMADTADGTRGDVDGMAELAATSSGATQSVASAAEQLSRSIEQIARQVTQSAAMTRKATADVTRADEAVQTLVDAAGRVGTVVAMISDVAQRTNLLALNATIEAARAGEAGRGFTVVAQEVKSLATQTASATSSIDRQIECIRTGVAAAVATLGVIADTVAHGALVSQSIADAVEHQRAATEGIVQSVRLVSDSSKDIDARCEAVRSSASRATETAREVAAAAAAVRRDAEQMTRIVDGFIESTLAA